MKVLAPGQELNIAQKSTHKEVMRAQVHDLVVEHSWRILSRAEEDIPADLKKLSLPLLATKNALERLRASAKARPGGLIKKAIQKQLHREFTF